MRGPTGWPLRRAVIGLGERTGRLAPGSTYPVRRSGQQEVERVVGIAEDITELRQTEAQLRTVRADPGHLEQLLMNLAVNARDAMPKGGTLTVATDDVRLDEAAALALGGARAGQFVRLSVTDTGCGMTPEVRARIFEPFFTTKPVGRGTGLGLATVFGIVQKCDGFIEVRTRPGQGSTFSIYLPVVDVQPEAPAPTAERPSSAGSERVLLVEDEAAVRRIAVRALRSSGYHVTEAPDGAKALLLGLEGGRPFDLLVTDVVMPGMSGTVHPDPAARQGPRGARRNRVAPGHRATRPAGRSRGRRVARR